MKNINKGEVQNTSGGFVGEISFLLNLALPYLEYVGVGGADEDDTYPQGGN